MRVDEDRFAVAVAVVTALVLAPVSGRMGYLAAAATGVPPLPVALGAGAVALVLVYATAGLYRRSRRR